MPAASRCRSSDATAASTTPSCSRSTDELIADAATRSPAIAAAIDAPSAPARRSSTSTSTASRPRGWACRSATSSARSRPISARPTSTTSTSSAAPTRSASRPTSGSALTPEDIAGCKVRNADGEMVPLGTLATVEHDARARSSSPSTTSTRRRTITGAAGAGLQLGPGARAAWSRWPTATLPPGMGYEWTGMSYQEKQRRQPGRTTSSRWRCCWSTSCSPASTRAGSRRSR